MKEYEKMLLEAEHRKLMEKAVTMVKLGLFSVEDEASPDSIDFTNLEEITVGKLYKGVFHLYEDQRNGDLFFINPLVEDNKGDNENYKDVKPYAYQVVTIDNVTDEEYEELLSANQVNKTGIIGFLYKTQIVFLVISLIAMCIYFIDQAVSLSANYSVGLAIYYALFDYMLSSYCLIGIEIGALVLTTIVYRKYKNGL